jgi:hypothetical protein
MLQALNQEHLQHFVAGHLGDIALYGYPRFEECTAAHTCRRKIVFAQMLCWRLRGTSSSSNRHLQNDVPFPPMISLSHGAASDLFTSGICFASGSP